VVDRTLRSPERRARKALASDEKNQECIEPVLQIFIAIIAHLFLTQLAAEIPTAFDPELPVLWAYIPIPA
jgi:hypothetical protein